MVRSPTQTVPLWRMRKHHRNWLSDNFCSEVVLKC